jgi:hypothetical protein
MKPIKKTTASQSAFFNPRVVLGFILCSLCVLLALLGFSINSTSSALAAAPDQGDGQPIVGASYKNDVSPALRDVAQGWPLQFKPQHEAAENPKIPNNHQDSPDTVVQDKFVSELALLAPRIPGPILNFNGIRFPGVGCNCAPPDTNGSVGSTQFVQIVNEGYQVFDKATGNSVLGPNSLASLWSGFGGACENFGFGDPTVVFDKIANRWVITQFASRNGNIPITDYCIAVSTTDDATGAYNRYGFHLSNNFIDYPKLGVWPDAYYLSINLFNSSGTAFLGPQPFAFNRAKMIAGMPATFIKFPPLGSNHAPFLPSDLDGNIKPPPGAPNTYVEWPASGTYNVYHFHVDFVTSTGSTFTLFASPPAAPFTQLCPTTRACVPQLGAGGSSSLDAIGDRLMYRLAYRRFGDGHESLIGNYTVKSNNVAAVRWFELRRVTAGPVRVFQENTYQPDATWRWMGSAAMDKFGNLVIGFSASSPTIHPQIRYAGRLATDPLNTLAQGEAHLFNGAGSQLDTGNRWGDYSSMAIDPVDDRTFWYTTEYYNTNSSFNWRTRIGNFHF